MNLEHLLENLKKRLFVPYYADTTDKALDLIRDLIPKKSSIGFGGSVTVEELNLVEALNDDYQLLHRSLYPQDYADKLYSLMQKADWYITSTNALSMTGELINIDGRANRVSAMLFGPKNIIVVCGINKIVNNVDEGIHRTRNIAAPLNALRLNKKAPCAFTNKCEQCFSTDSMCKATVIQHHPTSGKNVYIIIIDQKLGY